jgi:hypothetical protein
MEIKGKAQVEENPAFCKKELDDRNQLYRKLFRLMMAEPNPLPLSMVGKVQTSQLKEHPTSSNAWFDHIATEVKSSEEVRHQVEYLRKQGFRFHKEEGEGEGEGEGEENPASTSNNEHSVLWNF